MTGAGRPGGRARSLKLEASSIMEEESQHDQQSRTNECRRRRPSVSRTMLLCCIGLASMHHGAAAAAPQNTTLCSCSDLLWRPAPPAAEEVVNWHNRLVVEVTNAEAHGVRFLCHRTHACCPADPGSKRMQGQPACTKPSRHPLHVHTSMTQICHLASFQRAVDAFKYAGAGLRGE